MKRALVLLAEDYRPVAEALVALLKTEFEVAEPVEDGLALLEAASKLHPDVIVADISMPRLDGLGALARLKQINPAVKVVLITMYGEQAFVDIALKAGASGLVLKHSAALELVPAVRAALDGNYYVSAAFASRRGKRVGP